MEKETNYKPKFIEDNTIELEAKGYLNGAFAELEACLKSEDVDIGGNTLAVSFDAYVNAITIDSYKAVSEDEKFKGYKVTVDPLNFDIEKMTDDIKNGGVYKKFVRSLATIKDYSYEGKFINLSEVISKADVILKEYAIFFYDICQSITDAYYEATSDMTITYVYRPKGSNRNISFKVCPDNTDEKETRLILIISSNISGILDASVITTRCIEEN